MQPPENMTLNSGDTAKFLCTVDMTCMVSYVEWYKHNDNGNTFYNLTDNNLKLFPFFLVSKIEEVCRSELTNILDY